MIEAYRMFYVNLALSIIVLFSLFFFRILFPKKKIYFLLVLIIISILPIISIFRKGVYESGDFTIHTYHTISFYNSLKEGIIIPSWAGELNNGYGYPLFLFLYILPYYFTSFFHFIGFSFVNSVKILLALSYISSGVFMYLFLNKYLKNSFSSFCGSILYLFTPYHLVDLHFRNAVGELLAFSIAPIIFHKTISLKQNTSLTNFLMLCLLFSLLLLAHPTMFIFFLGISTIFAFFLYKEKKQKKFLAYFILSILTGFLMSSFTLLTRIFLTKYTHGSTLINSTVSFVKLEELLFSPWRYGFLFQGEIGQLSYLIGYTQILILFVCLYIILKKFNKTKKFPHFLFWFLISTLIIFFMLEISKPVWKLFPILNLMQFNSRLLLPLTFSLSILFALLTKNFIRNNKVIYLLIAVTILYTILNWGHRKVISDLNDEWLIKNLPYSTMQGEGMIEANPIWWNKKNEFWIKEIPKSHLQIIEGKGDYKEVLRTNTKHIYIVKANTELKILENTFYFPGWTLNVNNSEKQINYTDKRYNARITFSLEPGLHFIELSYSDIPIVKFAKRLYIISTFIIICTLLIISINKYGKKFKKHFINSSNI